MPTTILTIRGVPVEVKNNFKAYCSENGLTMTDVLVAYMNDVAMERKLGTAKRKKPGRSYSELPTGGQG